MYTEVCNKLQSLLLSCYRNINYTKMKGLSKLPLKRLFLGAILILNNMRDR